MPDDNGKRINEIIDEAMEELDRDGDDAVDRDELRRFVAERMPFDEERERLRRAEQAIARRQRPGSGAANGQLRFADMEPYVYEPARHVEGPDKAVVENERARPAYKTAEARRTLLNAQRVLTQAQRRQQEASFYGDWAMDQVREGAAWETITFGRFVREAGHHEQVDNPPPEDPDGEPDD